MTRLRSGDRTEAEVTIDGVDLDFAQSMTLRVAVTSFHAEVSDPEQAAALGPIAENYRARCEELIALLLRGNAR